MTVLVGEGMGNGKAYLLLVGIQTCRATVEINGTVTQGAGNRSTSNSNITILRHIIKGLYILLQRYFFDHVRCCSIYGQKLETPSSIVHQQMNG